MSVITSFSQSALSLFLAVYIGLFLNVSVYYRRFDDIASLLDPPLPNFCPR